MVLIFSSVAREWRLITAIALGLIELFSRGYILARYNNIKNNDVTHCFLLPGDIVLSMKTQ